MDVITLNLPQSNTPIFMTSLCIWSKDTHFESTKSSVLKQLPFGKYMAVMEPLLSMFIGSSIYSPVPFYLRYSGTVELF